MVNLSPDTDTKSTWSSGYLYDSPTIRCFSHIHAWQLSGIAVMPTVGTMQGHLGMDAYQSRFSHEGEVAEPGYHKVHLQEYNIGVELTSTTRVGFHRYTFPRTDSAFVLFDTGAYLAHGPTEHSEVRRVSDREIEGMAVMGKTIRRPKETPVYFVARFSKPFAHFGGWQDSTRLTQAVNRLGGKHAGAYLHFQMTDQESLLLKVAISYTSLANARSNLEAELPHWDFDRVHRESTDQWNAMLGRIRVEGGTEAQRVKFYTDLWHSLLGRRILSDVNGDYPDMTGPRPQIRRVALDAQGQPRFPHYNFDAWWGSHWSLNILWSMVYPEIMDGFCNTMVDMYHNGGLIPRGPSGGNYTFVMIGDPAVSFFATAYNKGIRTYDVAAAYEGLRKNAFVGGIRDHAGYEHRSPAFGGGMQYYETQGWVPEGIGGPGGHKDGASMTLEYAYQDWCLAQLAQALGKTDDATLFRQRAGNYKHLWNPATRYMHPREKDGSWIADFTPVVDAFNTRGFCESNAAIYTHYVPHDMAGLIRLFGGAAAYSAYLDSCFIKGQPLGFVGANKKHASTWVDYGNQPGTQMAHLFNYAGKPWLTQKWVREVKMAFNDTTPYGGYDGDEDQGQMGALGVLMAIGLFEVDGGASTQPFYEISSPLFDRVEIKLNRQYYEGERFVITTENNATDRPYIQAVTLNGKPWRQNWFSHELFQRGGELHLRLGTEPNKKWGTKPPPSLSAPAGRR
ncbi:alpha-1,2-mannosidase, putative [Catalinimonas alkaloidigena]|uniref:Alpha-1,2-mannosidase, putative n=2 Tax=Catalinimonas alkaloidigena TaxID=1075417 RepID=A0A1G9IVJ1_9BACT|nr:alpha-1,2-mannosidase, putative [Catalinimonas alkaloidigena]